MPTRVHKTAGNRATSFPGVREVSGNEVGNRAHRETDSKFYRQQFSFVGLIFGLAEQFEVVCLSEVEKT